MTDSPQAQQVEGLEQRKEHERMARLGSGLMLMKLEMGAPIADPVSHPDKVTFNFAGVPYMIVRADLPRAAADSFSTEMVEAVAQPWICVEEKPCEEAVPVHWQEMITALAAMRAPRAGTGLSVEAALAELREMFPVLTATVNTYASWAFDRRDKDFVTVRLFGATTTPHTLEFNSHTLNEAMDQVRAWTKSRAEREGEKRG